MGICTLGGIVEPEYLAFKKHTVVVDKHRAIDELESAFAVILEIAECVEGVGVIALRLYLKTQLHGLPLRDFVSVRHHIYRERIGLLHIEVVGTGSHGNYDCEQSNPEPEKSDGCKANIADV